jgi:hypothetical protein
VLKAMILLSTAAGSSGDLGFYTGCSHVYDLPPTSRVGLDQRNRCMNLKTGAVL